MGKKILHNFSISPVKDGSPVQYKVEIDGENVRARGYAISQRVGELPKVSVDLLCEPDVHFDKCCVALGGVDVIASIISKSQLLSLVRMYNENNPDDQVEVRHEDV